MRAALVALLIAGSAPVASAGTYLGLGIGTAPASSGDLRFWEDGRAGRSGRLQAGYRFGRLSIEGQAAKYDLEAHDGDVFEFLKFGLAGKFNYPLGDKFELFARAGIQHTGLIDERKDEEYSGSGFYVSGGVEYVLDVGAVAGSIFIDYSIDHTSLTSPYHGMDEFGLTTRVWTLGANVSL